MVIFRVNLEQQKEKERIHYKPRFISIYCNNDIAVQKVHLGGVGGAVSSLRGVHGRASEAHTF